MCEWVWDTADDQNLPPTEAVYQTITHQAATVEKSHSIAAMPCCRNGMRWGYSLTLSYASGPSLAHEWFINPHQSFPFRFILSPTLSQKHPNIILLHFTESCQVALVMFQRYLRGYLNQSYLELGVSMAPQSQTQSCYQFKCFAMKHQMSLNL